MQDKKPLFLTILNVSLNPLQTDVTLLANNSQHCPLFNIVGSCCVCLHVALGLSVKKYLYTKRRCHNELESVLLWLPFVIVTEETGYEYWRTVKMKTTVFSLWVQLLIDLSVEHSLMLSYWSPPYPHLPPETPITI